MQILKPHTLCLSLALLGCSFPSYAQLMFSQYIDGTANKKGLEIYNPDASTINLADYEIQQYTNGVTSKTATYTLQGNLASKAKFILGRSELQAEIGNKVNQVAGLAFNGDDALVLLYKGTPVDRFGRIGERPASGGWGTTITSYQNSLSRIKNKNDVSSVDPNSAFDLDSEWTKWSDRNAFSTYLGGDTATPPATAVSCSTADTPIADLQSATQNQQYVVRGVITADYRYQDGFSGFYIQTPDTKAKANLSNAIFVYIPAGSTVTGGKVGEEVILKGRLTTYQNQLQLDQLNNNIGTCNNQAANLISATPIQLPFSSLTDATGHSPKRYQGMLVKMPQTLTVSENYDYGRYGQLSLSLGRLYIPTNLYPAKSAEAIALAKTNLLSKIILDDGYNNQNRTPWLPANFNAANTLRTGYQLKNVEGILEYRFNAWRIQPIQNKTPPEIVKDTNPRNSNVPAKDTKQVRVAAFNVLNYDNSPLIGVKPDRGANTSSEFNRQHAKTVSAIKAIDADVYGLMEIANNGYGDKSAVAYLTKALGADWKYVIPPNMDKLGTDVIAVAIIYNSKRVKTVGNPVVYDDLTQKNRVTMAQSFQALTGGKTFTVIPNHLKSKGSCPDDKTSPEANQNDGQGCWNPTRVTAVQKLIQWIATNPTKAEKPNYLLVGDMNSYAKEDPILAFEKANYKVLLNDEKIGQGKLAYSYVFGVASDATGNGGAGNLDHAIADANLYPMVKRTFAWHINADEPTALDYNEEFKTEEQIASFYSEDAFRSSDHDPVVVDLDLNESTTTSGKSSGGSTGLWSLLGLMLLTATSVLARAKKK
ncbi:MULTISPECIES: ExeM/NucH family extracellular endonuclease [Acinetobacter]|uniref:ExeM/NucH family extracellular endonuclease n=1 Tax=Acinetobacter TaxID=469 RepID=UPI0002AEC979|nr:MULTISPECIES: ExeM/NucH family extracellular endonuclease [Acinetobacter]ELW85202.1 lamin tail domain protein [Acinetobacter sp. WC-743]MBJ8427680.1 ExeM/NucH family extracellular endonuclease [Acinetobacter bereziniae]MBJ8477065.1 ExeM/NucH family extracellular endonuclease [Acinetobacter bereziniae]